MGWRLLVSLKRKKPSIAGRLGAVLADAVAALSTLATVSAFAAEPAKKAAEGPKAAAKKAAEKNPEAPKPQEEKPPTPQSWAQFDPTGYWVSVVTEDWRYRMITAPKGDAGSVPVNEDALKASKEWDVAKDTQAGNQCKAFGAAGIVRQPGRLHITWADEKTLRIEFEAGTQTRLLHFTGYPYPMGFTGGETPVQLRRFEAPNEAPSLQGYSVAAWKKYFDGRGFAGMGTGGGMGIPMTGQSGALMSITTRLLPGYLQSNGVPYSEDTVLTEYINRLKLPHDQDWLVITSVVEDPKYLYEPYITSTNFKREADGKNWHPTPCQTAAPLREPKPEPAPPTSGSG
jgi:hypothetical protein